VKLIPGTKLEIIDVLLTIVVAVCAVAIVLTFRRICT
jgi:hypothetical protein